MKTIFKIAWRNIWRNKVRSTIVILSITIGLVAGLFASGMVQGMMKQKVNTVIENEISHIQIHAKNFRDDFALKSTIPNADKITAALNQNNKVKASSERVVSMMMIGTTKGNGAVKVTGVEPENEMKVTKLSSLMVDGKYFEGVNKNPIIVSKVIAEKYNLKLKSKLVLTAQDVNGEIIAASFRVAGIYDSGNPMYDEMNVFVQKTDIQNLLGLESNIHEIAILLYDYAQSEPLSISLQNKYTDTEVLPWLDLATGMRYTMDIIGMYTYIIVGIILFALLFSIVNTMLMAVLERVKEIGVLMAVGMNKFKIFSMIMLETIFYALMGGTFGLVIGYVIISYFGTYGLDFGDAYKDVGFGSLIYTELPAADYLKVSIMVFFMAIIAAIYPALKALSLKPVEAIRK